MTAPATITVVCSQCDQLHVGEYDHEDRRGEGPVYAAVCPDDWLTGYYTLDTALTEVEIAVLRHTTDPVGITVPIGVAGAGLAGED